MSSMPSEPNGATSSVRLYVNAHDVYEGIAKFFNVKWIDYHGLFSSLLEEHLNQPIELTSTIVYTTIREEKFKQQRQETYHSALKLLCHNLQVSTEEVCDEDMSDVLMSITEDWRNDPCDIGCVVCDDPSMKAIFPRMERKNTRFIWLSPTGREVGLEDKEFQVNDKLRQTVSPENKIVCGISRERLLHHKLPHDDERLAPPRHPGWSVACR